MSQKGIHPSLAMLTSEIYNVVTAEKIYVKLILKLSLKESAPASSESTS